MSEWREHVGNFIKDFDLVNLNLLSSLMIWNYIFLTKIKLRKIAFKFILQTPMIWFVWNALWNGLIKTISTQFKMHSVQFQDYWIRTENWCKMVKMVVKTYFIKTYVFNLFIQHLEKVDLTWWNFTEKGKMRYISFLVSNINKEQ